MPLACGLMCSWEWLRAPALLPEVLSRCRGGSTPGPTEPEQALLSVPTSAGAHRARSRGEMVSQVLSALRKLQGPAGKAEFPALASRRGGARNPTSSAY